MLDVGCWSQGCSAVSRLSGDELVYFKLITQDRLCVLIGLQAFLSFLFSNVHCIFWVSNHFSHKHICKDFTFIIFFIFYGPNHTSRCYLFLFFLFGNGLVMLNPPAPKSLLAPRVDFPESSMVCSKQPRCSWFGPNQGYANSEAGTANDCHYMVKEFPLLRFLFGSLPGVLSLVTMAKLR